MPLTVDIDHDVKFVRVTGSGIVVLGEVLSLLEKMSLATVAFTYPKLVDVLDCKGQLSDHDMFTIGAWVRALAIYGPRGPIAFVTREENEEWVRMFIALAGDDREVRRYRTRTHALKWLTAETARGRK